ncbi:hypothetical protein [Streptomyces zaomyceticus]|uniref:hypothetical protein n=1 Tax=Streptomyces zaomyceticus TaxID=68286 RepID=UPI003443DC15
MTCIAAGVAMTLDTGAAQDRAPKAGTIQAVMLARQGERPTFSRGRGEFMDRRVTGGLVALCAPLFALAGHVVTAKSDPSPIVRYSLIGVCVMAATPIAIQVYRDMSPASAPAVAPAGGAVSPTDVQPGEFVVFDGGRTGDSGSAIAWILGCGFVGFLVGVMLFIKRSEKVFGPANKPSVFDEDPVPVLVGIAL